MNMYRKKMEQRPIKLFRFLDCSQSLLKKKHACDKDSINNCRIYLSTGDFFYLIRLVKSKYRKKNPVGKH